MGVLPAPTTEYLRSGDVAEPMFVKFAGSWQAPVSEPAFSGLQFALRRAVVCGSLEPARSAMLSGIAW